eukprot:3992765-Ditylum_brightwellii.AAC.1
MTTMPKLPCNTLPLEHHKAFNHTFHYDIVYCTCTSICEYYHDLWMIDKTTQNNFEYSLKSLEESEILPDIKLFVWDIGAHNFMPGVIFEQFDEDKFPHTVAQVRGAPAGKQSQNGLYKIHWQHVLNM